MFFQLIEIQNNLKLTIYLSSNSCPSNTIITAPKKMIASTTTVKITSPFKTANSNTNSTIGTQRKSNQKNKPSQKKSALKIQRIHPSYEGKPNLWNST